MHRFLPVLVLGAAACEPTPRPADQFVLDGAALIDDQNGDGLWQPGERARVTVNVTNQWSDDYMGEVGVALTTTPDIDILHDEVLFFGIFGNTSFDARFVVDAPPTLASGTDVTFTIDLIAPNCGGPALPCPTAQRVTFVETLD